MATALSIMTSSFPADRALHPFFKTNQSHKANEHRPSDTSSNEFSSLEYGPSECDDRADSLVPDPNIERRKRRKLERGSNHSSWDWFFQLQAEAGKANNHEATDSNTGSNDHMNESRVPLRATNWNAQPTLNPLRNDVAHIKADGNALPPKHTRETQGKLLRLDGAGGLALPTHVAGSTISSLHGTDESSTPKKRGRKSKRLIVVLRYGRSDPLRRKNLGEQISNVLQIGLLSQMRHIAENQPLATQAMNPSRPTHPFFLGKPPQKSENRESSPSALAAPAEETRRLRSYTQTFSTPGKLFSEAGQRQFQHKSAVSTRSRLSKPPFSRYPEATWPSENFVRVEPLRCATASHHAERFPAVIVKTRRFKNKTVAVTPEEDIIKLFKSHIRSTVSRATQASSQPILRLPQRLMETRRSLQAKLKSSLVSSRFSGKSHPAVLHLFDRLDNSSSAFDVGKYESTMWNLKYAPKSAENLLQNGREMRALRDWLESRATNSVETKGDAHYSSRPPAASRSHSSEIGVNRGKRKKRRKVEELDDFLVSSDEESPDMQSFTDEEENNTADEQDASAPKSMIQTRMALTSTPYKCTRKSNAVLLSGPHGCGKTTAAYAVAHELGFDVFEINSSNKRSGKDLLEKVGDMALNHQVRRGSNASDNYAENSNQCKTKSEQQSTLQTFFSAGLEIKTTSKLQDRDKSAISKPQIRSKQQKQSLILLEEVDVLFEDDKQFWETVIDLASQSKRPMILTCNTEESIPIDALSLYAIFRFRKPSANVAADYLLLIAALEGHFITYDAALGIYRATGHDLRASLTELNFWCQMAVGDPKGGLEWFMQTATPNSHSTLSEQQVRAISKNTYELGTGWLPRYNFGDNDDIFCCSEELLLAAWLDWGIDPSSVLSAAFRECPLPNLHEDRGVTPSDKRALLVDIDTCANLLSDCDTFSQVDLPTCSLGDEKLDTTQSVLPERIFSDYSQSVPVLQADKLYDYSQFDTNITIHICARVGHYLGHQQETLDVALIDPMTPDGIEKSLVSRIESRTEGSGSSTGVSQNDLLEAVGPVTDMPDIATSTYTGLAASSFSQPTSTLAEDVVPYLRSIVSYDMVLEQNRQNLRDALLHDTRTSKRLRTTKASRSALEGGQRATTRGERWFPKELDYQKVMSTFGIDWLQARTEYQRENGSVTDEE